MFIVFAVIHASAQTYTFECFTTSGLEGDSCDICPTSLVTSRSFNGLLIYRDSVPYKWIDQPYSIRERPGDILEYWEHTRAPEHTFAPEKIQIWIGQTNFSTLQGFKDSTFCTGIAPEYREPRLYATDYSDTTGYFVSLTPNNSAVLLKGGNDIDLDRVQDTIIINSTASGGGGSGTVTSIGYVAPAAGVTITGTNPVTAIGTWTFALANDLAAIEALSSTGISVRTNTDTWALRTITAGTGITVNNGDGVSGNPEIVNSAPDQTVVLNEGAGIDVTGTYPTFTIANTFTNNQSLLDDGTPMPGQPKVNFESTSDILWTLVNDGANTETEVNADIATNAVDNNQFRQSVARSVVGRAGNTTGDVADIQGSTANHLLKVNAGGTGIEFNQAQTGSIADDAVTYAKIQNVAANNVFLGNDSGAGAAIQELTMAEAQTIAGWIDGTGVANRLAYWSDANTVTSDAAFTVDAANDRLTVSGTVASTTAGQAWLNVRGGSITGSTNAIYTDANVSATLGWKIENVRNLAGAEAKIEVAVGGTTAADPYILLNVPSGTNTVLGVDNSDSDKFKITPGGTAPGSTANKGLIMTTDAATLIGVNRDAPLYHTDVNGRVRASTGYIGDGVTWNSGLIAFGTGAGTGGSLLVNSITGCDNWMYISFTTGNAPVANGTVFTATYPNSWPASWASSFVTWSPFNANAATDIAKFRGGTRSHTVFTIVANGTLTANTNYQFCYQIGSMD